MFQDYEILRIYKMPKINIYCYIKYFGEKIY